MFICIIWLVIAGSLWRRLTGYAKTYTKINNVYHLNSDSVLMKTFFLSGRLFLHFISIFISVFKYKIHNNLGKNYLDLFLFCVRKWKVYQCKKKSSNSPFAFNVIRAVKIMQVVGCLALTHFHLSISGPLCKKSGFPWHKFTFQVFHLVQLHQTHTPGAQLLFVLMFGVDLPQLLVCSVEFCVFPSSHCRVLYSFDRSWDLTCLCCNAPGTESSINRQTSPTCQNKDSVREYITFCALKL